MRRFFLAALAAMLGMTCLLPARPAMAYEAKHAELQRRITQLEGIVDRLERKDDRVERASYNQPSYGQPAIEEELTTEPMMASEAPVYRFRTYNTYPTENNFFANAEFGFLSPFSTNGDAPTLATANAAYVFGANAAALFAATPAVGVALGGSAANTTPTTINYQIAPRFTLGYQIPGGMGLRMRYFNFDHTNSQAADGAGNAITGRLRAQTLDIETFGTLRRGRNSGVMFGGFRYADYTAASQVTATGIGAVTARQVAGGSGLTAGVKGESVIGQSGMFSVNSGLRGSMLFGDLSIAAIDDNTAATIVDHHQTFNLMSIWEASIGSTMRRRMANGAVVSFSSSIEGQLWQGGGSLNPWVLLGTTNPTAGIIGTPGSFGMLGFWNSFGISY